MSAADLLTQLDSTDLPPTLDELGGAKTFANEVGSLPAELLPRAAQVLNQEETVDSDLIDVFILRLSEIYAPLSFDETGEILIRQVNAVQEQTLAVRLLDQLLGVFEGRNESDASALRAGYAIQAAVDLVRIDAGASEFGLLAILERVEDVPAATAVPLARAIGRLAETADNEFLVTLLERAAEHEPASAQAMLELGLVALRNAFEANELSSASEELDQAIAHFMNAAELEEDRADARLFAAAAKAVRALNQDKDAFFAELEALTAARHEYAFYDPNIARTDRVVGPIHSVAAWDVLVSKLRLLRSAVDEPNVTHLQPGLETMAEAYVGASLDTSADARTGLRAFTGPFIERAIERDSLLALGAEHYRGPGELPTPGEVGEGHPKD